MLTLCREVLKGHLPLEAKEDLRGEGLELEMPTVCVRVCARTHMGQLWGEMSNSALVNHLLGKNRS